MCIEIALWFGYGLLSPFFSELEENLNIVWTIPNDDRKFSEMF